MNMKMPFIYLFILIDFPCLIPDLTSEQRMHSIQLDGTNSNQHYDLQKGDEARK